MQWSIQMVNEALLLGVGTRPMEGTCTSNGCLGVWTGATLYGLNFVAENILHVQPPTNYPVSDDQRYVTLPPALGAWVDEHHRRWANEAARRRQEELPPAMPAADVSPPAYENQSTMTGTTWLVGAGVVAAAAAAYFVWSRR